jgi:hypothetical protein
MYNVTITSNLNDFQSERRFAASTTVGELKVRGLIALLSSVRCCLQQKLELITGAAPSSMKLDLRTKDAKPVAPLDDDTRTLQGYNVQVRTVRARAHMRVQDGMIVHVTDPVSAPAAADTVGSGGVAKYEISDDAYDKRNGRCGCA